MVASLMRSSRLCLRSMRGRGLIIPKGSAGTDLAVRVQVEYPDTWLTKGNPWYENETRAREAVLLLPCSHGLL